MRLSDKVKSLSLKQIVRSALGTTTNVAFGLTAAPSALRSWYARTATQLPWLKEKDLDVLTSRLIGLGTLALGVAIERYAPESYSLPDTILVPNMISTMLEAGRFAKYIMPIEQFGDNVGVRSIYDYRSTSKSYLLDVVREFYSGFGKSESEIQIIGTVYDSTRDRAWIDGAVGEEAHDLLSSCSSAGNGILRLRADIRRKKSRVFVGISPNKYGHSLCIYFKNKLPSYSLEKTLRSIPSENLESKDPKYIPNPFRRLEGYL